MTPAPEETLVVDVEGFEGPLDLLLSLARDQKVDLTRISVLALVEQYLTFIEEAGRLRLEIAADYLVMAAWLAYLKSRLLLPEKQDDEEPSGEELAARLAFRLRRLEAMRGAASQLMEGSLFGRDVFGRGLPEALSTTRTLTWQASLFDLLEAYGAQRQRQFVSFVRVARRQVFSLQDARDHLMRFIGDMNDWTALDSFLIQYLAVPELRATARASSLSASLELVREGYIELKQAEPFAPLLARRRQQPRSDLADG
ncbi:condensin subunit ScpA [Faunimonas pinastri]|uniref:Segregation and condensation protein A n=1 Tax=Faunimonas pinastri TaxID=1855383 RepID=A0A1H9CSI7_9HYPH|nr:ScpA family protein [Faunimonas pinastri]SEQ04190.1 condensin subunit ScpA [Faunimonas pinastri]